MVRRPGTPSLAACAFGILLTHLVYGAPKLPNERIPAILMPESAMSLDGKPAASGPFIGPASKPGRGLYFTATPAVLSGNLRMELRRNGEVVLAEVLMVPRSVTKATTVVFFAEMGAVVDQLRKGEAEKPGSVTVHLSRNDAPVLDTTLTEFESANVNTRRQIGHLAAATSACSDDCDAQFQFCYDNCDQRGSCAYCNTQYSDCLGSCPTCNDWEEVSRTKIGGAWTGAVGYFGLWYCKVTSYYTVEQHNMADCYPNRFVCDTDTVTFFFGTNEPQYNSDCCNYTQPQDISHSDYCGGDTCN